MSPDQQFTLALLAIFVPSMFALASSIILLVLNRRMKQYHDTVNSKMDMLLTAEKAVSRSEGVVEGQAIEKQDAREDAKSASTTPQPVVIVAQEQPVEVKVVTPPEEAVIGTTEKPMQVEVIQTEGKPVPVEVVKPEKENKT